MGITTINEVTVSAIKNWTDAIERERKAAILWNDKWGWVIDEYSLVSEELVDLKSKREYVEQKKHIDPRTVLPFPVTTSAEIGWLSTKPEFALDKFGPYPYTRGWAKPAEPEMDAYRSDEELENEYD